MNDALWLLFLRLGMLAIIYLFLFQVIWLLRRTLTSEERPRVGSGAPRLVVVEGTAGSLSRGQAFVLREATSIGRGPTNALRIEDPFVSTEHALLTTRNGQVWLEDLGSTNGTFVNRRQVDRAAALQAGDVVQVGQVKLKFLR
ncbi:MAG: FHA domain-containing protein [Chloroflexota bacterium]